MEISVPTPPASHRAAGSGAADAASPRRKARRSPREWSDSIHPLVWLEAVRHLRSYGFFVAYLFTLLCIGGGVAGMLYAPRSPHHAPLLPTNIAHGMSAANQYRMLQGAFWVVVCVPFLLVPASGFMAARRDAQRNILEIITMTRLQPMDIMFGKWAALTAHIIISGCLMLPFFILRYYVVRGANPVLDVVWLAELMLISSCIGACVIAVANVRRLWEAGVVFVVAGMCWIPFAAVYINYRLGMIFDYRHFPVSAVAELGLGLVCIFQGLVGIHIALTVGASQLREGGLFARLIREVHMRRNASWDP